MRLLTPGHEATSVFYVGPTVSLQHPLPLCGLRTAPHPQGDPPRGGPRLPSLPGEACVSCAPWLPPAPSTEPLSWQASLASADPHLKSPYGMQPPSSVMGRPWDAGRGMAVPVVPGFAFKTKTRPATTRAAPSFLGFRSPRSLRVGPAIVTLAWGAHFRTPTPPTSNSSSCLCHTMRSAEHSGPA